MNIKLIPFLILCILFGMNACCTKRGCENQIDFNEILFYNFTQQDLDTITIYSFNKNTNFSIPIDSFTTQGQPIGNHFQAYINTSTIDHDYKIILVHTGEEYTLTNFQTEKYSCNSCFPYKPKSDYYYNLNNYKVNGNMQNGQTIEIYH